MVVLGEVLFLISEVPLTFRRRLLVARVHPAPKKAKELVRFFAFMKTLNEKHC